MLQLLKAKVFWLFRVFSSIEQLGNLTRGETLAGKSSTQCQVGYDLRQPLRLQNSTVSQFLTEDYVNDGGPHAMHYICTIQGISPVQQNQSKLTITA